MARAIWNGVISFGMVSIPVGLHTAVQEKDISFNQIHKTCGSRIKQQKWCPVDEKIVDSSEIVKGYEYSKGHFVILTEEDFETLPVPSMHTIEVLAFVKEEQVDPIYFDSTYYVEPGESGRKPFALLARVLQEKKVAALGKIAMRSKEHLCLIRLGAEGNLVLESLFYPDEIREPVDAKTSDIKVDDRELKMAESLVDLLAEDFDPSKYQDEYRKVLMERIEDKIQGKQISVAPEAPETRVIDLMDALKASLEAAKKDKRKSS